jgi:rhodanese-related sulfurtransferase
MIAPFANPPVWLAIPIGIGFGMLLERGGLASARVIAAQLRFRDFTVVRVMFAAIVTAMLGIFWASRLGWLDMGGVGVPPTDIVPQTVGAVVFGAGFALAALCPGTACAAVGSGRLDGLAAIGGLFVGTLGVSLAWPTLGSIAERAPRSDAFLPADLGLPVGVVVAGIALAAIWALPRLPAAQGAPRPAPRGLLTVGAVLAVLAIPAGVQTTSLDDGEYGAIAREIAGRKDHVEPLDLAEWIRDGRAGLRVIDVGDHQEGLTEIPGAEVVPIAELSRLAIAPGEHVVLVSAGGNHAAQAWVLLRSRGHRNVSVLHDGLAGWEDEVLAPLPPIAGDPADSARHARARAVSAYFGGVPRTTREAATQGRPVARRRNTC